MSKKQSYMNRKSVMTESFLNDLLKKYLPGMHGKAEQKYIKKHGAKLEKKLDRANKEIDDAVSSFEQAWKDSTGNTISLEDMDIKDIIAGKYT